MRKLCALVLAGMLVAMATGCSKGSNQTGEGELLRENPRARHYDKDDNAATNQGAGAAGQQEESGSK